MADVSYTRLKTFEQCKHQYAQKYFKHLEFPSGFGIEAFVGQRVHKVVEAVQKGECPPKPSAAWEMFTEIWAAKFKPGVYRDVRNRGADWWRDHGLRCISNFLRVGIAGPECEVLGIEYNMRWPLMISPPAAFRGILDRLVRTEHGMEVHDFKTGKKPDRRWFVADHQLPLYAHLASANFARPVEELVVGKRIYLATGEIEPYDIDHARRMESWQWAVRTTKQITKFELEYEKTGEAPTNESPLCDWCSMKIKGMCPAFKPKTTPF